MKITTTVTGELLFTVDRLNPTFLGGMTGSFLCKRLTTLFPPELSRPQNRSGSELNHTQYTHTYYSSRIYLSNFRIARMLLFSAVEQGCR